MADMQADMGAQAGLSGGQMNAGSNSANAFQAQNDILAQQRAYESMQAKTLGSASGYMQAVPRKLSDVVEHGYNQACKIAEEADRLANLLAGPENAANAAGSQTASPTLVERAGHIGLVLSRIERSLARISAAL
jgi:hypothetical protein